MNLNNIKGDSKVSTETAPKPTLKPVGEVKKELPTPLSRSKASEGNAQRIEAFNPAGFGKAGNNAMDILLNKGYFKDKAIEEFDMEAYKELTKMIYKADQEAAKEIQQK
jgi:hypothetical protein